jgi:uncharacterized membrane protein
VNAPATAQAWKLAGWTFAGLCCVAYALLSHRAASAAHPGGFEALVVSAPILAVGLAFAWRSARRLPWLLLWAAAVIGVALAGEAMAAGTLWLLLLQAVGVNAAMGLAFGRSLAPGSTPLVSRFAQVVHGPLSPRLAGYTRGVTVAWVMYFAFTVLVTVVLFFTATPAVWSAFVNLMSLPLLALMFVGEYLVRILVIPASERSGFFQAVAAYRKFGAGKAAGPH